MKIYDTITARYFYPSRNPKLRVYALWYFVTLITLWTVFGHWILGFEQSYAQPMAAVASACFTQFLLEWVDANAVGREARYAGGWAELVNFLIPAWIPGLAVAMLTYPNQQLLPVIYGSALSIASKVLFRAPVGQGSQHIFNPSNFGITTTFLLFTWIGLAPPYQFTENVTGIWHWIIPGAVLFTGIIIHALFTGRLPLCLAWISGFVAQGLLRAWYFDIPWRVPLVPMTSAAFILFTLYMIPDPATTPLNKWRQVVFGLSVAAVYGLLITNHVAYGLFIALFLVCAIRGIGLYWMAYRQRHQSESMLAVQ